VRKEGEDLSPRTGRRPQVRTPRLRRAGSPSLLIRAAGVMSCSPVIAGDVDRNLSTKAMDDENPAGRAYVFPPLPCVQGSYRAEQRTPLPGRSRGGKRGVQERGAFVPVLYVS
jgi:hypothetical protein